MSVFIGIVVLLGGLIFFHELGHYTMAKLFGVKVEVFSLGFGKKIIKKVVGETEYCISIVPLGGYVKLMGDDPYKGVPVEDTHRAFSTQKLYKRFIIVAAGPTFNFILAYFLLMVVFWFGQPLVSTKIGHVQVGSPAWEAGLRSKDRVLEIDGKQVLSWNELEDAAKLISSEKIDLKVMRDKEELRIPVAITSLKSKSVYGEDEMVKGIKGISPSPHAAIIGISNPQALAYRAGLRSGDQIFKIGSTVIETYEDIQREFLSLWNLGNPVPITVKRQIGNQPAEEHSVTLTLPKDGIPKEGFYPFGVQELIGIFPSEVFVKMVTEGSPAQKGGLIANDRIVKVHRKVPIYHFDMIVDYVQERGAKNEKVQFTVEREGKVVDLELDPMSTENEDPITRETVKKFMVGFVTNAAFTESDLTSLTVRDPIRLISKTWEEIALLTERMVVSMAKLIAGKISVKNLGGPVLIASVAGKSLDAGIIPFLQMMALISINLFLLNLFPIPVLDGGHLFFFTIEAIKGKPVSLKTMEVANQVGMVFILMLVGLTLYNDISRMILH